MTDHEQTEGVCLSDMAIRAARAEMERDAAIKRAEFAEDMLRVHMRNDPVEMLEKLHIMGIPAKEMKDIYNAYDWHIRNEAKA